MKRTVIITGANGSLGLWTAKFLLEKGLFIIMACRNIEKAKKDIKKFKHLDSFTNYTLVSLDLSDFKSIQTFVNQLSKENFYNLICNAGMSYTGSIRYSKQEIEETFCSNYLGHFLLTNLLLEKVNLERILFISSALHDPSIKSPFAPAVFKSVKEMAYPETKNVTDKSFQEFYATAKLCEILFAYELDRRLNKNGQKYYINTFNPGLMALTDFGRRKNNFVEKAGRYLLHIFGSLFGFATTAKISGKEQVKNNIFNSEESTQAKYISISCVDSSEWGEP